MNTCKNIFWSTTEVIIHNEFLWEYCPSKTILDEYTERAPKETFSGTYAEESLRRTLILEELNELLKTNFWGICSDELLEGFSKEPMEKFQLGLKLVLLEWFQVEVLEESQMEVVEKLHKEVQEKSQ